jgi:hypothetical protein
VPTSRAVLDTNLIVSYLLTQGDTLSRIIDHWERGSFVYLISPPMFVELKAVLARPRLQRSMSADPQALLEVVENDAMFTAGTLSLAGVSRDPKDDIFLACAVEGNADYIVTGDADLLVLKEHEGIKILRPHDFLGELEAE